MDYVAQNLPPLFLRWGILLLVEVSDSLLCAVRLWRFTLHHDVLLSSLLGHQSCLPSLDGPGDRAAEAGEDHRPGRTDANHLQALLLRPGEPRAASRGEHHRTGRDRNPQAHQRGGDEVAGDRVQLPYSVSLKVQH